MGLRTEIPCENANTSRGLRLMIWELSSLTSENFIWTSIMAQWALLCGDSTQLWKYEYWYFMLTPKMYHSWNRHLDLKSIWTSTSQAFTPALSHDQVLKKGSSKRSMNLGPTYQYDAEMWWQNLRRWGKSDFWKFRFLDMVVGCPQNFYETH